MRLSRELCLTEQAKARNGLRLYSPCPGATWAAGGSRPVNSLLQAKTHTPSLGISCRS